MSYQHKDLAAGRWSELPFLEQMANIASEVGRALKWKAKNNDVYCKQAYERALELIDLTLDSAKGFPCLKEVARMREALVDFFIGSNQFNSTEESWQAYLSSFTFAARRKH